MMSDLAVFQNITKAYHGVPAVRDVSLAFKAGEIHSLVGENGAGKSTLAKVLAGVVEHTSGKYLLDGREVRFHRPSDGLKSGIAMVHQETSMVPSMTVAQNLYLGREPGVVRLRGLYIAAQQILQGLNFPVDPRARVQQLGAAHRQMVEIARAVLFDARIIIFDEPTATLTPEEKQHFFDLVTNLRDKKGVTIVFISHALEECLAVSDRISVLRDGALVESGQASSFTRDTLISAMAGRENVELKREGKVRKAGGVRKPILEVQNLKKQDLVKNTSFSVFPGEVTGVFGLVGSGRTELSRIVCGDMKRDLFYGGRIYFEGEEIRFTTPREAIEKGIIYITEDRKHDGFFEMQSVAENIKMGLMAKQANWKLLAGGAGAEGEIESWSQKLQIKSIDPKAKVIHLSGGNQQKCVIAKSLIQKPKLVIFDEPTRGVDVGTIAEIHKLIASLADEGLGVVVISSYLPEIFAVSDRIMVMRQGRVVETLYADEADEEQLLYAAVH